MATSPPTRQKSGPHEPAIAQEDHVAPCDLTRMSPRRIGGAVRFAHTEAEHQDDHDPVSYHDQEDSVPADRAQDHTAKCRRDGGTNSQHEPNQVHDPGGTLPYELV